MNKKKNNILRNPGFQSFLSAIICIAIGVFIGYLVLLAIFFASKASPKFHRWIQKQKLYQKIVTPIKKSIQKKQKLSWLQAALVKLLGIKI